jgi:hypothetical protein
VKHDKKMQIKARKAARTGAFLRQRRPKCFNSRVEWLGWRKFAMDNMGNDVTRNSFCADCTPEYQAQMIRERRCAYPGTTFEKDEDGFIYGRRPGKK